MSNKLPSFMKQSQDEQKNAQHTDEEKLQPTTEALSDSQQSLDLDEPDNLTPATDAKPHREIPAASIPKIGRAHV